MPRKSPAIPLDPAAPIRSLRELLDLSGVDFAASVGMSKQSLANLESRGGNIRLGTLADIARGHGFDVEIRVRKK